MKSPALRARRASDMRAPRASPWLRLLTGVGVLVATACAESAHVLRPAGAGARAIATLTWFFIALSGLVFAVVLVLLVLAVRARGSIEATPERDRRSIRLVVIGGALVPAVILTILFIGTLITLRDLSAMPAEDGLVIEVVGRQWWWEIRYTDGSSPTRVISSANEIHIPTGVRVPLRLTAADVIHSFWVPALQGKLDLVPGRTNRTWLQADRPGTYEGACAEYCGLQHTRMNIQVIAHEPAGFAAWLARESRPGAVALPTVDTAGDAHAASAASGHGGTGGHDHEALAGTGRRIFEREACSLCHRVRGTAARGTLGPDLTHVGSRRTLAAMLPNNRGNLGGWISNPQVLKPGTLMPRVPLTPDELHAVIAYLEGLE